MENSRQAERNNTNVYLTDSLVTLFTKTATPIILIMAANGLFTLVDAYYLGKYVSADALTAVTLMFPVYMLLVAISTLVSSGYSSVLARLLGAGSNQQASLAASSSLILAMLISAALIVVFLWIGKLTIFLLSNGDAVLSELGHRYILILVLCSPISFCLSIGVDTFRSEGRMPEMILVTVLSTCLNFVFNYLFIVQLEWGVAGSAIGTVCSQLVALVITLLLRKRSPGAVALTFTNTKEARTYWAQFISLGVPSSLAYVGMALAASLTIYCIQVWAPNSYSSTAGAYGIVTRLMTFTFLPMLGLSVAFQTIVGNNYGAKLFSRSLSALKIALIAALVYSASTQLGFYLLKDTLGYLFVDEIAIATEVARIISINTLLLFAFGPLLMITAYFQAIGKAIEASVLSLSRTYIFSLPLIFLLPFLIGETGIWYAAPTAELCMILTTATVLLLVKRKNHSYFYTELVPKN